MRDELGCGKFKKKNARDELVVTGKWIIIRPVADRSIAVSTTREEVCRARSNRLVNNDDDRRNHKCVKAEKYARM